jgi:hypothetical protein
MGARDLKNLVPLLSKYGMQADLQPPPPDADLRARQVPGWQAGDETRAHMLDVVQRFIRAWTYADMPWREAQDAGLLWAPLRKPHENALDEHWLKRRSFADVFHRSMVAAFAIRAASGSATDELAGRTACAVVGPGHRAYWAKRSGVRPCQPSRVAWRTKTFGAAQKPFPLQGVKILDFAWFLASAVRFLAAMDAEASRWSGRTIRTRLAAMAPIGGARHGTQRQDRCPA